MLYLNIFIIVQSNDVTNEVEVTQAGWGLLVHHDNWGNPIDDAFLSTCMTTESGDLMHRFERCDLRDLVSIFENDIQIIEFLRDFVEMKIKY